MKMNEEVYGVCGVLMAAKGGKLDDGTPWHSARIGLVGKAVKCTLEPHMIPLLGNYLNQQVEVFGVPKGGDNGAVNIGRVDLIKVDGKEIYNRSKQQPHAAAA